MDNGRPVIDAGSCQRLRTSLVVSYVSECELLHRWEAASLTRGHDRTVEKSEGWNVLTAGTMDNDERSLLSE